MFNILHVRLVLVAAAVVLLCAGCTAATDKEPRASSDATAKAEAEASDDGDSVASALALSRKKFELVSSFRTRFTFASGGIEAEGDAVYRSGDVVYAHIEMGGDAYPDGQGETVLYLPPDLYVRDPDDNWFVESPWQQGIRPDERTEFGLQEPMVDYAKLTRDLYDVKHRGEKVVDGATFDRYTGEVKLADLTSLVEEGVPSNVSADIEILLDVDTRLPATIEIDEPYSGVIVLQFSDYDREVALPLAPASARPIRDAQFPNAPCTGEALAACLEVAGDVQGADSCAGTGRRLCLAPLGRVSAALMQHFKDHYRELYGLEVTVLRPSAVPAELEDPLREQIDADGLITYMGGLFPEAYNDPEAVLIGITPVDIYDATSHFRYLFGLRGDAGDPKAVVSVFRMDPLFYSEPADEALTFERSRKLLTKYIGLLYYELPTSPDPASPMFNNILGPDDLDAMQELLPVEGA